MKNLTNKQLEFLVSLNTQDSWGPSDFISLPGMSLAAYTEEIRIATKSLEKMIESCKGYIKTKPVHVSLHVGNKDTSKMYYIISLTPKGEDAIAPVLEEQRQKAQKEKEEAWKRNSALLNSAARDLYGKPYAKCGQRQKDAIHRELAGWTG